MLDGGANGDRGVPRYRRFKEFWGGDVRVVRERGARVAHNSPHEPGGPCEWLVTPPDGVLLDQTPEGLPPHYTREFPPM